MSNSYTYEPLRLDRSLRILTLHPAGQHDAPLIVDLRESSLEKSKKNFDALSYVWGPRSPIIDSEVLCCGKKIAIGPNCDAALRRLRFVRQKRRLFVDALCLNQEDSVEKEKQVKLMGEFYVLARRVLIWLGEGSAEITRAFKYFRRLYEFRHLVNGNKISKRVRRRIWNHIADDEQIAKLSSDRDLHFWLTFIDQPYFERVWPLQETAVASRPTLVCGSSTVSFRAAMFSVFFMTPYMNKMVGGMNRDRFWLRYEGFRTHESLSTVYKLDNHLDAWQRPEDVRELQGVLVLVRSLQAQNPLDRLYSLYTILQGFCPDFPKPNYSIAPSTLWASATSAMIQSMRCLDLILDVYHGQGANLPSWSFDWDFQGKHMPWVVPDDILDQKRPPGSSWDQAPKLELILKPAHHLVLRIKGRIFTKVGKRSVDQNHARSWYRDVHPTLKDPDATGEMSTLLNEATRILFEWAIPRAEVESTVSDAAELCRHLIIWAELPEEDAYKAFNTWYPHMRRLQWLPADGKLDEPDDAMPGITRSLLRKHGENLAKHFHDQTCLRRLFRCFFVTEDGRTGDGRYTIREGDLVVLLCWSKVPAIIRPTAEDPSLYTLVSFSYIHGLVDCHAWNLKEEELQEFALV